MIIILQRHVYAADYESSSTIKWDINGDGEITQDDRTMIGNPTPDLTYGFNLNLNYKNFDLGVDMMGVYGNEIYRTWDDPTYAQLNYLEQRMDRWNGEGTSNWEPILNPSRSINLINSNYQYYYNHQHT